MSGRWWIPSSRCGSPGIEPCRRSPLTETTRSSKQNALTTDDERLKSLPVKGSAVPDDFDEMLVHIRDIRASERRMYLRVREVFAMAADHEPAYGETTKAG